MFKKSIILLILFILGFIFGVKADSIGFNSLAFKKNLDAEIDNLKQSVISFGKTLENSGWFAEIFGDIIIFVGTWAEWLFLLYVILVVIKMIFVYLR